MQKQYITADQLLKDSLDLAFRIIESGFRPDMIVGIWRGGTPVGIAVQEVMEFVDIKTDHIAIRASSYTNIGQ
ncbi:MAG: phosphoribosyltransferase, partial [Pseudomonadales bacterium]